MAGTGLAMSSGLPPGAARPPMAGAAPGGNLSLGGVMSAQSLTSIQKQQDAIRDQQMAFDAEMQQPGIMGLAGHISGVWELARDAKQPVEQAMLEALYARRGEYTAAKKAQIQEAGQPLIYMMLAATKMRQAESLLRDTLIGAGTEKPWTLDPTPMPELPPFEVAKIKAALTAEVEQAINAGLIPTVDDIRVRMIAAKDQLTERLREEASAACDRMELKMEDQLVEGGFNNALDQFITDLTTFKAAFIAGPIVRRKPKLTWVAGNPVPVVKTVEMLEWERVDPFDMYPAPWARNINEGPLIRKHKLTREHLTEMIGVEGFSVDGIRTVLDLYGSGGLNEWLSIDSEKSRAEGKTTNAATQATGLIDALQFWGSVSGKMLLDWGMKPAQVPDPSKEYQVETWMIGSYVIKAVLNSDPLARRPFYSDSYERIPGNVWGNCVYDLMVDCADMCNAAARSLAANLGISSGPQVVVNVSRLPTGESITAMYPWKVWQTEEDPMGNPAKPIEFFQPQSNAGELMQVYEKFSVLADEYTGIPRYATGGDGAGGAGRTASGLSMMLGNASKIIKQVVSSIDAQILTPLLERLYYTNMRYSDDPDLKGDVKCVARGAMSLTTKDAVQMRRADFLAATNNPTDIAIMGMNGRAELLRAAASQLDLNPSKIVPPIAVVKQKQLESEMAAQAAPTEGTPAKPGGPTPVEAGNTGGAPSQSGQALMDGSPVSDNFSPPAQGGQ